MPRDQKPRRGNDNDNDDDNDDDNGWQRLCCSPYHPILSLFFVSGNFNSFAQVFIYTSYDKKEE